MSNESSTLAEYWRLRNACAMSLGLAEDTARRAVEAASVSDLVDLLESFSPARTTGPEWARTLEPLVERLWLWRDAATMAELESAFKARGIPWMAVANALSPENGERLRYPRHPAVARLPALTTV